jgi:hypothetical protein
MIVACDLHVGGVTAYFAILEQAGARDLCCKIVEKVEQCERSDD